MEYYSCYSWMSGSVPSVKQTILICQEVETGWLLLTLCFLSFRSAPPAAKEISVIYHSLGMKLMPPLPQHLL